MADERDFRIEHSELRADDEFAEFASTDLPYYSDWRGSFEKLPWATDDEALARRERGCGDRGRAARRRGVLAARGPVRSAGDPDGADRVVDGPRLVDPARRRALPRVDGGRRGRRAGGAGPAGARPPRDPREGVPGRERRADPDRPRRRSLGHVSERRGRRAASASAEGRHRALRRARRHRRRAVGQPRTGTARRCAT